MEIGILDFGEIGLDNNATSRIHQTIELAQYAEKTGLSRYWLAEHQNGLCAWRSPEVVVGLLAGYTERIKIGTAGTLLCLYAPIKIAQDYKLLENLFPGRIDLGLAKGIADTERFRQFADGADFMAKQSNHYQRVEKVMGFLNDVDPETSTSPLRGRIPEVWVLGAGVGSAGFVTRHKLSFSLSLLHSKDGSFTPPGPVKEFMQSYYSAHGEKPKLNLAVSVYCTESRHKKNMMIHKTKSMLVNIAGPKSECIEKLARLQADYGVDELIVLNLGEGMEEKMHLMEAISDSGLCRGDKQLVDEYGA